MIHKHSNQEKPNSTTKIHIPTKQGTNSLHQKYEDSATKNQHQQFIQLSN